MNELMNATSWAGSNASWLVRADWRTSPLTLVSRARSDGSASVSTHGPSGHDVSNPLALVHCPSVAWRSRNVTSLAHV